MELLSSVTPILTRGCPLALGRSWLCYSLLGLPCAQLSAQVNIFSDAFESGDTVAWTTVVGFSPTVRLIVIGDSGEGNAAQVCVAQGMDARCAAGGCSAVLMAGDNFYDDGVASTADSQWNTKFETVYDQPSLTSVPFYAVLGEHDYAAIANFPSAGDKQAQIDYTSLSVGVGVGHRPSSKWNMPAAWYDVVLGNGLVHLFALDTQDTQAGQPADQPDDMAARVAASTATWKLVMGHFPRFTSGSHQTEMNLVDLLLPSPGLFALQQSAYCAADLYVSGHDHDRELIDKGQDPSCSGTLFLVSGAGSKVTTSTAVPASGSLFFDDSVEGFALLEATAGSLRVELWDSNASDCSVPSLAFVHSVRR